MVPFEVRLLGPVEVVTAGQVVRPSAAKVRAVLAMLALHPDRPLSTGTIADRLWAGMPPATAGSIVRTYVTQVRRLLPDGDARLRRDGDGYVLRLGADEVDVLRFERLLVAASSPTTPKGEALALLEDALDLWRGDPLVELADDPVAQAEAARLDELRWTAVEQSADAELALGRNEAAVARLEAAVREAPLREQLVSRLMLALYRGGRQADALAEYQRLRRALLDDLGLDPSEELRLLEAAVLAQDASLEPPPVQVGNVPATSTSFVGRDDDVERLVELLTSRRLVTLTGAGGSGKTRLAVEVARTSAFRDGAWLVELGARRRPVEVARSTLSAFGVDQRDQDAVAAVCAVVGDREVLLVLDNCEHLLQPCAELVSAVLARCADTTVLATSRAPLAVPGELVWEVPPLATPEAGEAPEDVALAPAAALLADRISAARGGTRPAGDEWHAVARLCQQVDGLPLAIELVAARARTLALGDLAAAVGDQALELDGRPSGPDHHRSLAACVEWSLDLLDDDARHLLRHVSLLPGWFSAGAAAAVAGVDDALMGLADLASQSLLQARPGDRSRFRVLETIRQVVVGAVSGAEAAAALDALVGWAAALAESVETDLRGPAAARLLDELEADLAVLHAALDHGLSRPDPTDAVRLAAAVSGVWAYRGHLLEGQELLDRAVAAAGGVAPSLRLRVLVAAGSHRITFGDVDGFRRHVDAALTLARSVPHTAEVLRTLLWAGHAVHLHGEHDAAAALYDEALGLARAAGDGSSLASALAGLGDVAAGRGDLDGAAERTLEALAAFRAAGDRHGEGQALLNLAEVDRLASRFDAAEAALASAADVFRAIGDRSCVAAADEGRARLAYDTGRLDAAEQLYRGAAAVRRDLHQHHRAVADLQSLASVLAESGRAAEAAAVLGAAGDDAHPLTERLRRDLGDRAYLTAWADGSIAAPLR